MKKLFQNYEFEIQTRFLCKRGLFTAIIRASCTLFTFFSSFSVEKIVNKLANLNFVFFCFQFTCDSSKVVVAYEGVQFMEVAAEENLI